MSVVSSTFGPDVLARILDEAEVACLMRFADGPDWHVSPGFHTLLGATPGWSSFTGEELRQRLHTEDTFDFLDALARLDRGERFAPLYVRFRHTSGDWRNLRCSASCQDGADLLIFVDLTKTQQLEAALLDSQMRLRSLYDATPVPILLWSREGRITDWNQMATAHFGHARETAIGQKLVPLLIHAEDYERFSAAIGDALRDNQPGRIICRTLTAYGDQLLCEWHSVPLRNTKGSLIGVLSLALDITARMRAEENLRQSRDMAEELSQAKSEFMATISHELRTPLNGVLGMAQLLGDMLDGKEEQEFARVIVDSGNHLLSIVNAIVTYTEIDTVRPEDSIETGVLTEMLMLTAEPSQVAAFQKDLAFTLEIDAVLDRPHAIDRRALATIVTNLLSNAVRFTEAGSIHLVAGKEVGADGTASLCLKIADSGIGMSADFVTRHLYTPFKQAENAILRKHGGVGLGLALVKKLVDRVGGTIEVASQEAEGSCFTVRMPLFPPAPDI